MTLPAPFPWFGGKRRVADIVWSRFGNVPNYVEPFAGSLAVLLARPHPPRTETVNDIDCYLSNFWRALQANPDGVAQWADSPVNEADLLARHRWLKAQTGFRDAMRNDPHYFDAKIAGWWVWGLCAWIGQGWCDDGPRVSDQIPHLRSAGQGINRTEQYLPHLGGGRGINRKLPHLGDAGRGINRETDDGALRDYLAALAARLRYVRVACGDWSRVTGDSVTFKHGITGIFLDPPYSADEHSVSYAGGKTDVAVEVAAWAREQASNPLLRIALCGYEGEHVMPGWSVVEWKSKGGYGVQAEDGRGRDNSPRERIWFSPACLPPEEPSLFDFLNEEIVTE